MSNNRFSGFDSFPLESLPEEIINEIPYYLDKKDLINCRYTSKKMFNFFQQPLLATQLLPLIKSENYKKIEELVKKTPQIIFQHVSWKIQNEYEIISPLKFAFKILDTPLWELLRNIATELHPSCITTFNQQVLEQKENYFNLNSLISAYNHYEKINTLWQNKKISYSALQQAWFQVGKEQSFLPVYFLNAICRTGKFWTKNCEFENNESSSNKKNNIQIEKSNTRLQYSDIQVYDFGAEKMEHLQPEKLYAELGNKYTLIRGPWSLHAWQMVSMGGWDAALWKHDLNKFQEIYKKRVKDFKELVTECEASMPVDFLATKKTRL